MNVVGASVSFTEVEPGAHDSYNRWHLFDHLPEQYQLAGIAFGQRWVLVPEQRATAQLHEPLDRVHYVTLYLMTEPFAETLAEFKALGQQLYDVGRFHDRRHAHLGGPLRVHERHTAPHSPLDPGAVPFAPHRSVRVVLDGTPPDLDGDPHAIGTWTFDGMKRLDGRRLSFTWRDAPPDTPPPPNRDPHAAFDATLAVIDPFAPFTWFDEGAPNEIG